MKPRIKRDSNFWVVVYRAVICGKPGTICVACITRDKAYHYAKAVYYDWLNAQTEAVIQRDKLESRYSNEYETAPDGRMLRG